MCDGCDKEAHLACLKLAKVPRGKWYCPFCQSQKEKGKTVSTTRGKKRYRPRGELGPTTVTMQLAQGQRVLARWPEDNEHYPGVITKELEGGKFAILFDDGDEIPDESKGIPPASIEDIKELVLPTAPAEIENFKVGDRVSAYWVGQRSDAVVVRVIINKNTNFVSGHLVFFTLDNDEPDERVGMKGLVRPKKIVKSTRERASCWQPPEDWEEDYLDNLVAEVPKGVLEPYEKCVKSHYPTTTQEANDLCKRRRQQQPNTPLKARMHEYFAGSCMLTQTWVSSLHSVDCLTPFPACSFTKSEYGHRRVSWFATT